MAKAIVSYGPVEISLTLFLLYQLHETNFLYKTPRMVTSLLELALGNNRPRWTSRSWVERAVSRFSRESEREREWSSDDADRSSLNHHRRDRRRPEKVDARWAATGDFDPREEKRTARP